ncbi:MAG TPA: protein kinase [Thermoanaerobaculia bacterium]|nr:protein kinase [Thermoanaerobaculia bacterium]
MTLPIGTKLGPYEVVAPLGAGGMGEVYKARDTRLERTVAVKVLPSGVSSTPEARQRFEREARTISKLSHPHICALHDVGREGEIEYLVMEYLEGETLAERLAKGALSLEQTLRYGQQIADALDKAHRRGIVHRDLKPGNVMLTKSGVKLLDFGLAKVIGPEVSPSELTSNPTAAAPSALTQEGTLLGTLPYMAPEQLEGKEADARTDIFALGATLYEMVSGHKAFSGSSRASLISSILRDDPRPASQIEPTSPAVLDRVIGRCLAKDPERRWQSAADVGLELDWIARGGAERVEAEPRVVPRLRWPIGLTVAAVLVAALAVLYAARRPAAATAPPIRFSIRAPQGTHFPWVRTQSLFAVSPDGQRIVFVARSENARDNLWVRALSQLSAVALGGTEGAAAPFWSPDSRSIAFFADGKLKRIDAEGGPSVTLCDAPPGYPSGSWGSQHAILFSALTSDAVEVVAEGGGSPRPAVRLDPARQEVGVSYPSFLPDGRHFLYVARSAAEKQAGVRMASLDGGESVPLLSNSSRAEYAPGVPPGRTGYLLFARDGALFAQPFESRGRPAGNPVPVGQDIWQHVLIGSGPFSASSTGVLAARGQSGLSRLVWYDRAGKEIGSLESPGVFDGVRLSPDDRQVAASRVDPRTGLDDILVGDLARQVLTRLDLGPNDNGRPHWSPDGARLTFSVGSRRHPPTPYWISLRGAGSPEPIIRPTGEVLLVEDWSPDGRYILVGDLSGSGTGHGVIDLEGERKFRLLVGGNIGLAEAQAQFSPDGRWIALCLIEGGRSEIYLISFPKPGERIRVSANGGLLPRWRRDGRELYYVSAENQLMAMPVHLDPDVRLGAPRSLFRVDPSGWREYDVTAGGERFLAVANLPAPDADAITVVVNWPALIRP